MPVALLAILLDRAGDGRHLRVIEWCVFRCGEVPLFDVGEESVHVPCVVEQLHGRDAVADAVVGHALQKPVPFTLLDDVVVFSKVGFAVRSPNGIAFVVQFRLFGDFLDLVFGLFVGRDSPKDGPDILLIEPTQELEVFMPLLNAVGLMFGWPGIGDVLADDLRQQFRMFFTMDLFEQSGHEGIGLEEILAGTQGFALVQFGLHQRVGCRVVRLHDGRGRHMPRNPFGVPHHRQQVACRQTLARTVADTYFFR